jgi:hypothetical protein
VTTAALAGLIAALTSLALDVRGGTGCPTPSEVAERLGPLWPQNADLPGGSWLEMADVPGGDGTPRAVEVRLMRAPGGDTLAMRRLPAAGACAETAQAIAVVVATWAARYSPLPSLPLAESQSPAVAPGAPLAAPGVVAQSSVPVPARIAISWLGAGAGTVLASRGGAAPFIALEGRARRRESRWAARLELALVGERTIALGDGTAGWSRQTVSPGVVRTWGTPEAFAELGAGALLGAASLHGRGFARNQNPTSFDAGVTPWARAGARLAAVPVTLWAGAGALIWLRPQALAVGNTSANQRLPPLDLMVGGGVAWIFDR